MDENPEILEMIAGGLLAIAILGLVAGMVMLIVIFL